MPSQRELVREKKAQQARQARMVQMVGAGVIVLLIAVIVWQALPKKQASQQTAAVEVGNQPACQGFDSIPVSASGQYDQPPMGIDTTKQYFATVKMANGGEFVIQLFPDKAPITVNSFVFLACKGFFNGVTFHRVLEGFMAQGGDPTGTGGGGPGYGFVNEDSDLTFDKAGVVAMANAGRDTNGSQFFITFGPADFLNGGYTIFGQVVQGMDVVNSITRRDPETNPNFTGDAMESVTITTQ
jgi:cyclophilin family peptidyl-prolyl cis-trans isomerase